MTELKKNIRRIIKEPPVQNNKEREDIQFALKFIMRKENDNARFKKVWIVLNKEFYLNQSHNPRYLCFWFDCKAYGGVYYSPDKIDAYNYQDIFKYEILLQLHARYIDDDGKRRRPISCINEINTPISNNKIINDWFYKNTEF